MRDHLKDIYAGTVTKTNVIGLRKAINAAWRRDEGYSVSSTAPKIDTARLTRIRDALQYHKPVVVGELHESGLRLLNDRRYRRRLECVAPIIARLKTFRLVGYYTELDPSGLHAYPLYRATDDAGRWFEFFNKPWQAGGDGPQVVRRDTRGYRHERP